MYKNKKNIYICTYVYIRIKKKLKNKKSIKNFNL